MNDLKSLLPTPDQYIGSCVFASRLVARSNALNLTTALTYRDCQIVGGAFTGGSVAGTGEATVVRMKVAGVVTISATCIAADGADLAFSICIRQPGDSGYRAVASVFQTLKAASAVRGGTSISLPLPAGTEILVDGTTVRTALDEGIDQMNLSVAYLGPTNCRSNLRYGA